MTSSNLSKVLAIAVAALACPMVAQAEGTIAAGGVRQPTVVGKTVVGQAAYRWQRRHRSTGSYTRGVPDGAGTGSRKQTPTGGNAGGSGGKS